MPDLEAKIRIRLEVDQAKRDARHEQGKIGRDESGRVRPGTDGPRQPGRIGRDESGRGRGRGGGAMAGAMAGAEASRLRPRLRAAFEMLGRIGAAAILAPTVAGFVTEASPLMPDWMRKAIRNAVNEVFEQTVAPVLATVKAFLPAVEQTKAAVAGSMVLGKVPSAGESFEAFKALYLLRREDIGVEMSVDRLTRGMHGMMLGRAAREGMTDLGGLIGGWLSSDDGKEMVGKAAGEEMKLKKRMQDDVKGVVNRVGRIW